MVSAHAKDKNNVLSFLTEHMIATAGLEVPLMS